LLRHVFPDSEVLSEFGFATDSHLISIFLSIQKPRLFTCVGIVPGLLCVL
jgi:hypothetical protein